MQLFVTSNERSRDDNGPPTSGERERPATSHKTEMFCCPRCRQAVALVRFFFLTSLQLSCWWHVMIFNETKKKKEERKLPVASINSFTNGSSQETMSRSDEEDSSQFLHIYRFSRSLLHSCSLTFVCMLIQWIMDRISSDDDSTHRIRSQASSPRDDILLPLRTWPRFALFIIEFMRGWREGGG